MVIILILFVGSNLGLRMLATGGHLCSFTSELWYNHIILPKLMLIELVNYGGLIFENSLIFAF